ncbi:MAG: hypothetical protein H6621_10215 [Halobacteriovoraceae bacterium]|nr:hypothetical protein [Halobacteriovoraceae bacterium]MCB9095430.1 hypothetical protein [Halobacteriovoraceae bacterium]
MSNFDLQRSYFLENQKSFTLSLSVDDRENLFRVQISSQNLEEDKDFLVALEELLKNQNFNTVIENFFELASNKAFKEHQLLWPSFILLNSLYDSWSGNEHDSFQDNLICPCFKISKEDILEILDSHHPQFHSQSPWEYLKTQSPVASVCDACVSLSQEVTKTFVHQNARHWKWKDYSNVQWMKFLQNTLGEKASVVDFYNGKLYVHPQGQRSEIESLVHKLNDQIKIYY